MSIRKDFLYFFIFPFVICLILIGISLKKPIGDFGNYYYGSKLWTEGKSLEKLYTDTHWFNEQIALHGETDFFENYAPVPPFSLLFYRPLAFFSSSTAKLVFNLISVLIFCLVYLRYIGRLYSTSIRYPLVPLIVLFPLYQNLVQGQLYILICAALMEIHLASRDGKKIWAGLLIALVFHLKIFPAFILLYFIVKREWKIVLYSLGFIALFAAITFASAGTHVTWMYITDILPRLAKNEIVDPFYRGHQTFDIMFRNLFCYDELKNPSPLIHSPRIGGLLSGLSVGFILYYTINVLKNNRGIILIPLCIFSGLLVTKYLPSYSFVMLIPFALAILNLWHSFIMLLCLAILINLPTAWTETLIFPFNYLRVWMMLLVFMLMIYELRPKINYAFLLLFLIGFSALGFFNADYKNNFYYQPALSGIQYSIETVEDSLMIKSCYGENDRQDILDVKVRNAVKTSLPFGSQVVEGLLVNDSLWFGTSDYQQGVGLGRLRVVTLK